MARYYPGGSRVPGSRNYDPEPLPNDIMENNAFSEWLYSDWDEGKYKGYLMLNSIPFVRDYMNYLLDFRKTKEYMDRNQVDWDDIHDPRNLYSTSSATKLYGSALNFVSDNVKRLYR